MAGEVKLQNLLHEEVALLRDFLALLQREQQTLTDGDIDRLLPLASEKSALFGRLATLSEARNKSLVAQSLPPDRAGVDAWLAAHPDAASARKLWAELLAMTLEARELNRVNGSLINTRLANNQQALTTLLAAANQAALYGPDGQTTPIGSGRSLGSY